MSITAWRIAATGCVAPIATGAAVTAFRSSFTPGIRSEIELLPRVTATPSSTSAASCAVWAAVMPLVPAGS